MIPFTWTQARICGAALTACTERGYDVPQWTPAVPSQVCFDTFYLMSWKQILSCCNKLGLKCSLLLHAHVLHGKSLLHAMQPCLQGSNLCKTMLDEAFSAVSSQETAGQGSIEHVLASIKSGLIPWFTCNAHRACYARYACKGIMVSKHAPCLQQEMCNNLSLQTCPALSSQVSYHA